MYMLKKKWKNCKENKGNNKVHTHSQDNPLTLDAIDWQLYCGHIYYHKSLRLSWNDIIELKWTNCEFPSKLLCVGS